MERLLWAIGSAITVVVVAFTPAALSLLWLSTLPPSDGMEGLLVVVMVFPGAIIFWFFGAGFIFWLSGRSNSDVRRPAMLGACLPVVLVLAGIGMTGAWVNLSDQTDEASEELAVIVDAVEQPGSQVTLEKTFPSYINGCDGLENYRSGAAVTDDRTGVATVSSLVEWLEGDGWTTGTQRVRDPLETRELWTVGAYRSGYYFQAKINLFQDETVMDFLMVAGDCPEQRSLALLDENLGSGVLLPTVFEEPSFPGLELTDVNPDWWAPRSLTPSGLFLLECDRNLLDGWAESPWLADEVDPIAVGLSWFSDLEPGLTANGWQTEVIAVRDWDDYDGYFSEKRTLRAVRGDTLVVFTADFRILGSPQRPHVQMRTDIVSGACIEEHGLSISHSRPEGRPVPDLSVMEPLGG